MQAGHVKDLGLYQEGGSVAKIMTMFLSYPRLCYNAITEHALDAYYGRGAVANGRLKSFKDAARVIAVIETMARVSQLARDVMTKGLDTDRYKLDDYLVSMLTFGSVNGVFFIGNPISNLIQNAVALSSGERTYNDGATPLFEDMDSNLRNISKMLTDPKHADFFKGVESSFKVAGYAFKPAAVGASLVSGLRQAARLTGLYDDKPKKHRRHSD